MTSLTPWWANDPTLAEIRRRTAEDFGIDLYAVEPDCPAQPDDSHDRDATEYPGGPSEPDPVMTDFLSGRCRRELTEARDGLADARDRYDEAVLAARIVGFSWAEIGSVLGVARQQLHRQFGTRQRGRP